ncbi:MAG: hypothetical protein A2V46_14135 [Bacteroidetes bacterium RBG_19FT_COMBO_42_7]|nr:MAG: hypothetical protein A2Y71_06065 [Bacteroidetes bacterium RBG_13_42_15]OFY74309.1 MAG: hypothetical protein A2V46_14135 [Bacteroidetes bacterium RBG_19FT_COMBO_42_7]
MVKFIKDPLLLLLLIVTSAALLFTSCESWKKDPRFIGDWQFIEKITADNLVYNTTRTIKLTKNTYEETYVIQRENSAAISAIIGTRGDLGLTHTNLIFTLEEIGTCALDELEACTEDVLWYGAGTQYWTNNISFFERTVVGEYEIIENTLWLIRDLNNDGDSEDAGEDVRFEML